MSVLLLILMELAAQIILYLEKIKFTSQELINYLVSYNANVMVRFAWYVVDGSLLICLCTYHELISSQIT